MGQTCVTDGRKEKLKIFVRKCEGDGKVGHDIT
jgi:hypothetical protein